MEFKIELKDIEQLSIEKGRIIPIRRVRRLSTLLTTM